MFKGLGVIPFVLINLNNTSKFLDNSFLKEKNFYYENEDLIVKGNINNLDSNTYLDEKPNKDLLIFDYDSKIDNEYYGFFYDFESDKTFYLETNSTDLNNLKEDLKTFYQESNSKNIENTISLASESENLFKEISASTVSKVEKPYGRMAFTYSLMEYEYSSKTSLYLLQVKQQFISGSNCIENFESGYQRYYNDSQFVHIQAAQNKAEMGYDDSIYSGVPKFKDAYPVPKPSSVTITSSYEVGVTFGYSLTDGFSKDGLKVEEDHSYGVHINFGYSKSYTTTNPMLSSQLGENLSEYQWNYYYQDVDSVTNYQVLGYMFECNRYQNGIDTHNKFGIVLSAKATYSTDRTRFNRHDVTFLKNIM